PMPKSDIVVASPIIGTPSRKRGLLRPTSSSAIINFSGIWALANLILFLLPFIVSTVVLKLFPNIINAFLSLPSLHRYIPSLWVCSIVSNFSQLFAYFMFPAHLYSLNFFRYHLIPQLFIYHQLSQSHFSFMSQRQMRALLKVEKFTIFIMGAHHCSIPIGYSVFSCFKSF
ncbi:hypothetical protein L208DRAFT_1298931, partial [Tricholoma matsutake]